MSKYAEISQEDFFDYFKDKTRGYAIEIADLNIFDNPIDVNTLENFRAHQSFQYIDYEF